MSVYSVFYILPDGDGYNIYDLIGIACTIDVAKKIVSDHLESCINTPSDSSHLPGVPHPDMTKDNNYTYFGMRSDCDKVEVSSLSSHRGYVVEKIDVK